MQGYLKTAFNIFLWKIFKHWTKLEEIYCEYPYIHHLYSAIYLLPVSIHIHQYDLNCFSPAFQSKFQYGMLPLPRLVYLQNCVWFIPIFKGTCILWSLKGKPRKLAKRVLFVVVRTAVHQCEIGCGAEYASLACEVTNKEPGRVVSFSLAFMTNSDFSVGTRKTFRRANTFLLCHSQCC